MDGRNKRKKNVPLRFCEICGKQISRNTKSGEYRIPVSQYIKARFCSIKCRSEWQKQIKGENNNNYRGGKSKCIDCGKELSQRYSYRNTNRCKKCHYKYYRGENHPLWQGGKTNINILQRSQAETQKWRISIFERDDFTCQICGDNKGHNLNAHHIKPWAKFPELRHDLNNGITLCVNCHRIIHKK